MATADYLNDIYTRLSNSAKEALSLPNMPVYEEEQVPAVEDASQPFPYAVVGIRAGGQRLIEGFIQYDRQASIRIITGHFGTNFNGVPSSDARRYLALLETAARNDILTNATNAGQPDYVAYENEIGATISGDTGVVRFRPVNQAVTYSQLGFEMTFTIWIAR